MGHSLKQRWRAMTGGQPGRRFEDRYEAARQARHGGSLGHWFTRILLMALALAAFAVGAILAFIPGPAILFFFLAGSLLAAESRGLARLLDWSEVRLRILWQGGRRKWTKLPGWGQVGLVVLVAGLGAASTVASYRLLIH